MIDIVDKENGPWTTNYIYFNNISDESGIYKGKQTLFHTQAIDSGVQLSSYKQTAKHNRKSQH